MIVSIFLSISPSSSFVIQSLLPGVFFLLYVSSWVTITSIYSGLNASTVAVYFSPPPSTYELVLSVRIVYVLQYVNIEFK